MRHALIRRRTSPYQSVFRLEKDPSAIRNIFRDQGRDTNAKVDKHSGPQLCGNPLGDGILCVQGVHVLSTK